MAKRRTEDEKETIVADYIELGSYAAVARLHGLSSTGVKKIVGKYPDSVEKFAGKKREAQENICEHILKSGDRIQLVYDKYIDALLDDDKVERATPNQLTTALGTILDKYLQIQQLKVSKDTAENGGVVILPEVEHE